MCPVCMQQYAEVEKGRPSIENSIKPSTAGYNLHQREIVTSSCNMNCLIVAFRLKNSAQHFLYKSEPVIPPRVASHLV